MILVHSSPRTNNQPKRVEQKQGGQFLQQVTALEKEMTPWRQPKRPTQVRRLSLMLVEHAFEQVRRQSLRRCPRPS